MTLICTKKPHLVLYNDYENNTNTFKVKIHRIQRISYKTRMYFLIESLGNLIFSGFGLFSKKLFNLAKYNWTLACQGEKLIPLSLTESLKLVEIHDKNAKEFSHFVAHGKETFSKISKIINNLLLLANSDHNKERKLEVLCHYKKFANLNNELSRIDKEREYLFSNFLVEDFNTSKAERLLSELDAKYLKV